VWPFTRKADASTPASAPPAIHFQWKEIPAIQRTIADHPLTVLTEPFAAELTTHQDPRAVAKPLGHQVTLEAPRGLALGIARPQLRHDGPDLVPRMRPNRAVPVHRTTVETGIADSSAGATADEPFAELATTPPRQLYTTGQPPPQRTSLMHVDDGNAPVPMPLSRGVVLSDDVPSTADPDIETPGSLPALPRLTLGQSRRLGLGAPIGRVPATAVQRTADGPPTPSVVPSTQTRTEEPSYIPIFPLDFPRPKPVIAPAPISRPQRIPTTLPLAQPQVSSLDVSAEDKNAVNAEPTSTSTQPVMAPLAGSPPVVSVSDPRAAMLDEPVKGEREGIDEAPRQPLPLAGTPPAPTAQREVTDVAESPPLQTAVEIVPLLSARPLTALAIQRASERRPTATETAPAGVTRSSSGARRPFRGGDAAMTRATVAERDDLYVSPWKGSMGDAPARTLPVRELVQVSQQRPTAGESPEVPQEAWRVDAETIPIQRSVAAGPELPLARSATPALHSSTSWLSGLDLATQITTIQRVPETVTSGPAPSEAPATLTALAGESHAQSKTEETHLNELAAKLYDKIRSRLRHELLVDRERAGFLTDLR